MKILLLSIGRTADVNLKNLLLDFNNRVSHYVDFSHIEIQSIKNSKNLSVNEQMDKEASLIKKQIINGDYIVLLDEKGKSYDSISFSTKIESYMMKSYKRIVFIIGGPYGFSDELYSISNEKLSLSKMTFSHQMVRLFFVEQLYRAFTIIRNEKYHNR
mgnify:FL=1